MGKVKGKHRLDKYYRLAKEHGYRSRASWKLIQLDSKFSFLHSSRAVLDLCAAPGGWMQVAVQRVPVGSLVLGIDLVSIAPIRGALSFEQDITKPECKTKIKKIMDQHGCRAFDLVLHDGSPNVGGAWAQEAMTQNALVIDAVKLATQLLAPKGNFITKVFRSQDYTSVLYCLKQLFEKVEVDKPSASRSASAEIYVLGLKYKAPAKIDPRILDVKHLFQGSVEPPRMVLDPLRPSKQKRHRGGYEDGDTTLRKVSSAADFIWSNAPLEILGSVTSINFMDEKSLPIKDHALSTEEVKMLCDDLRVLGKQDFKHLLKWRLQIRKDLSPSEKAVAAPPTDGDKKEEVDEDDKLLNEMEELKYAIERKKKREKKLLAKRRDKDKTRKATGMQIDAMQDGYTDYELFSLSSIKGKNDLVAVDSPEDGNDDANFDDSDREESREDIQENSSGETDSDEERKKYDEQMEEILEQAYERFLAKKDGSTKQRKRAKQAYSEQTLEGGEGDDINHLDYDSDKDPIGYETNPLVASLDDGKLPSQQEITNKWFNQGIFSEAVQEGDLGEDSSGDKMNLDNDTKLIPEKSKKKKADRALSSNNSQHHARKADDDIEIVPAPVTDSSDDSSSDEEEDDYDVDKKAEILACATKMLRKKKRENMLDDAYNKYMFHDDAGLPKWFLEEEIRHRQINKPVTKEEINAMKAQFKEIDARPAKKVAQAKARKKRVAMRRLEKVRKKANTIADQTELNDSSKTKMIDKLYKNAAPKRPKKEYVVAKKGVQVRAGKGKVVVDRRMKKDSRAAGKSGKDKKGKNAKAQKGRGGGPAKGGSKMGNKGKRGKSF